MFTQPKSETGDTDASPTVRSRRIPALKTPKTSPPAEAPSSRPSIFDVQTLSMMRSRSPSASPPIPALHPNLHNVLPKILAPNITPTWLTSSLIPFLTTVYGSSLANKNLDRNVWPEAIENADLLIRAMGRAAKNKDFAQKYYTALMSMIYPLYSVEIDEFCEKLALQSADFAIIMWCMLESREARSLVWERDRSGSQGMEE
jgi:hypothetical protein